MKDLKKTGRITGVLYFLVIVCAGFSQGVVRESIYVAGDAAMTAQNILNATSLFRWGLITDLIAFSTDVAISVLLYVLLKSVHKPLALAMAAFRLIAHPGIATANLLNHFAALKVLESPGLAAQFSSLQLMEFSQFFMEMHHLGYILAGVTFGVHCFILGYLLMKSYNFPTLLGILMICAAFGYLTESFGFILYPEYKVMFGWIVGISAALGEVSLCIWLMVRGARIRRMK
ncbi:DUF4386 domain-containing protein [Gracilimonas mengyeensis]|uniref:DUF4386 domain-containing protein n=1 Tax=Gracilimonas mengyeensis TaxID=1302730 RepID=A0A521D0W7_9BACT|nr:DUF4386 domain-containing protein [Gracilimonas mengyeensis]SMO65337.1 protein of unknown function [Gracilimonas mengyeensis]